MMCFYEVVRQKKKNNNKQKTKKKKKKKKKKNNKEHEKCMYQARSGPSAYFISNKFLYSLTWAVLFFLLVYLAKK